MYTCTVTLARARRALCPYKCPPPLSPVALCTATAKAGGRGCCWLVLCAAALLVLAVLVVAALVQLGLVEKQTQRALYARPGQLRPWTWPYSRFAGCR